MTENTNRSNNVDTHWNAVRAAALTVQDWTEYTYNSQNLWQLDFEDGWRDTYAGFVSVARTVVMAWAVDESGLTKEEHTGWAASMMWGIAEDISAGGFTLADGRRVDPGSQNADRAAQFAALLANNLDGANGVGGFKPLRHADYDEARMETIDMVCGVVAHLVTLAERKSPVYDADYGVLDAVVDDVDEMLA
ncbi:hypothetical protein [Leifsonia sp. Leaf264]|uniref:hypothetical protein n=1 Tax=Leifsonia sp. Leaf264 TaxID=1736314 RepID=UPI000701DA6A|nr:hypothetical protein [Leifsonia sp. Leaf264]KQO98554.1 hypothetical protein ASF30_10860 [Leifsonia sp. Leaf264]